MRKGKIVERDGFIFCDLPCHPRPPQQSASDSSFVVPLRRVIPHAGVGE